MEEPNNGEKPPLRRTQSLDDIWISRVVMAGVAIVLTLITLYVAHWVLVGLLGLGKLKAAVAIPVILGFLLPTLVAPTLPARTAIEDGAVRLDPAVLRRYLWREILVVLVAVAAGGSVLAFGSPLPTRSQVESVHIVPGGAQLTFQTELTAPPPFLNGLLISLAIVAFGTALAAASGAHKAWKIREAVNAMGADGGDSSGKDNS